MFIEHFEQQITYMKKILYGIIGLVFLLLTIWLINYFYQKNTTDPIIYETTHPFRTNIVKKTVATGSVKPRKEINIKPQVSGIVDELYVEAGEQITKGEPIAKIRLVPSPVNINNAQSSVELARIRLNDAKRELSRQRGVYNNKRDVEQAQINYDNAVRERDRQKTLFKDGVISQQAFNQLELNVELNQSRLENAKIESSRSLRQFETEVDIRTQELEAAFNNLQLLKEGASKKTQQVSNVVKATVAGMVLDVPVEEGASVIERNNFNEGTTIAIIADMNALIFDGKVDESDVGKLKEGMPLVLTVGALENVNFDAVLEYISPKGILEEGTVKFQIKADIQRKKDVFLRAGYSSSADIILDKRDNALALKERDVIYQDDSTFIEIEVAKQKFKRQSVQVGISDGINVAILSGVKDTTLVLKVQKRRVD